MPTRARPLTALLAVVLTLFGLGALAGPAAAHDRLVSSAPADGETLTVAPEELTLSYSANIATIGAEVVVTAPDGSDAREGDLEVVGTDVVVPLRADLPSGSYAVIWRVTSSDGHAIDGAFAFALDLPAPSPEPTLEPTTAQATPSESPTTAEPTSQEATTNGGATAGDPTDTASPTDTLPGSVEGLPGWAAAVIAVGIVGAIVAVLVRLRRSSRLREG